MTDEHGSPGAEATAGLFARLGAEIDNVLRTIPGSPEACEHFAHARIEVLKGIRAIIDSRIDKLSAEGRKGVSIKVE